MWNSALSQVPFCELGEINQLLASSNGTIKQLYLIKPPADDKMCQV